MSLSCFVLATLPGESALREDLACRPSLHATIQLMKLLGQTVIWVLEVGYNHASWLRGRRDKSKLGVGIEPSHWLSLHESAPPILPTQAKQDFYTKTVHLHSISE